MGLVGSFDGYVAGQGVASFSVITTPNQVFVPEITVAHSEITTFSDGRWGLHEYSLRPQTYDHKQPHLPCIPRQSSPLAPKDDIIWRTWYNEDWVSNPECGVSTFGKLQNGLMRKLFEAAERMISRVASQVAQELSARTTHKFLTVCLRHCIDRLRILHAPRGVIFSLATHAQRLILELGGLGIYLAIVLNFRTRILNLVGAHTPDPSIAQMLHTAGIPIWFQQNFSPEVVVWSVVKPEGVPVHFSTKPAFPRLVLAVCDLSGALNTPGEWQRAMTATVHQQLCASRLPQLGREEDGSEPRPVLLSRKDGDAQTLSHNLPLPRPAQVPSKKAQARRERGQTGVQAVRPTFAMNPFRQFYPSYHVVHSDVWSTVLSGAGPLPQPAKSVTYYFPPPWMFDELVGYEAAPEKHCLYLHQTVSIRAFCTLRLFDRTVAGRPLTIAEWRDALWGNYTTESENRGPGASSRRPDRLQVRHRLKQSLRELFCQTAALPSYSSSSAPLLGQTAVALEIATVDHAIRRRLVWEAHEFNWRCELLALDAIMVGSSGWPDLERWAREADLSEEHVPFCWYDAADARWEASRVYLGAFVDILKHWPGCPDVLRAHTRRVESWSSWEYTQLQESALNFYVWTFVDRFQRLPTAPSSTTDATDHFAPFPTFLVTSCLPAMGLKCLHDDELEFIERQRGTSNIRNILNGGWGSLRRATTRIHELYLLEFLGPLLGETDERYAQRLAGNPKARQFEEESVEDSAERLNAIYRVGTLPILFAAVSA
ncbi:hypothetical protein C8Q80DRAFT_1220618 [Daedaleopsis nitida]|nr:hypothetical protein C8Q80DRAFT_1220618 [Daedaleopsis nitida]